MDWRKLVSSTGVDLRGKMVHWQQIEGEVGYLLKQHYDPRHRKYLLERAMMMAGAINAHTGMEGLNTVDVGVLSNQKTFLQFVCADSRVVPTVLDPGEHFIIFIPIAGEALGGAFSYKQIVDLLPTLDGIVIEAHTNCGACQAANKAREGMEFDGSLCDLTNTVEGDIDDNLHCQAANLIERVGKELISQHQVAVFGVRHDIFAPLDKPTHTMVEETMKLNDESLPEIRAALAVYREIISQKRDAKHVPAEETQHPSVLWLSGVTIYGQFRRGIGSVHELVNEHRKGIIFKVLWQNPHDVSVVASARYILDHGDSVKQIVFTASSERDLWWDIESFVNNPELATYLQKQPGTELIGLVIGDNGYVSSERVVKMWSVEGE